MSPQSFKSVALFLTVLLALMLGSPFPAAANQRAVTKIGSFNLALSLVNDNIWLFEISSLPLEPAQKPKLSPCSPKRLT